jgi:hypothetical protein
MKSIKFYFILIVSLYLISLYFVYQANGDLSFTLYFASILIIGITGYQLSRVNLKN